MYISRCVHIHASCNIFPVHFDVSVMIQSLSTLYNDDFSFNYTPGNISLYTWMHMIHLVCLIRALFVIRYFVQMLGEKEGV